MNKNEFRLGNLIDFNGKILEIEGINGSGIYVDNPEDSFLLFDEFSGVKLTEDFILKNGFKHSGNGFFIHCKSLFELCNIGNEFFTSGFRGTSIKKIYFIHQLQNLYFELTCSEINYMEYAFACFIEQTKSNY